jgi:hypothetical protein
MQAVSRGVMSVENETKFVTYLCFEMITILAYLLSLQLHFPVGWPG